MSYNLLPKSYEAEQDLMAEDLTEENTVRYPNGIAFDYDAGDFVRDGKNKLADSNGIESWKSWCINSLMTERYKYLACSTNFGIELDPVFRANSRDEAESILTRQITEAIMADPYERAKYVSEIEYAWEAPDAVIARVAIQGVDDVSIDVTAYITKGGT